MAFKKREEKKEGGRGKKRDGKTDGKREDRGSRNRIYRKGRCKFCESKDNVIDYLDFQGLRKFTTERGKILPMRITGACAKHQRHIAKAIKLSREVGLMPYVAD